MYVSLGMHSCSHVSKKICCTNVYAIAGSSCFQTNLLSSKPRMSLTGNDTLGRSKMQTIPDASGFGQGWYSYMYVCGFLFNRLSLYF